MSEQPDAVAAAMEEASLHSTVLREALTHANGTTVCDVCFHQFPCAITVLAAEVERLTRLLDARPPYRVASFSPKELADLILRDREILANAAPARTEAEE